MKALLQILRSWISNRWPLVAGVIFLTWLALKSCHPAPNPTLYTNREVEWMDDNHRLHSRIQVLELQKSSQDEQLDSMRKVLHLRPHQVLSLSGTTSHLSIDTTLKVTPHYVTIPCPATMLQGDSIRTIKSSDFYWGDNYIQVSGKTGDTTGNISVEAFDSTIITRYHKRDGLFGAKKYYEDVTNTNPYVTVIEQKGILVHKESTWSAGLGLSVGYPINYPVKFNKPAITIGISLHKNIRLGNR